MDHTAPTHHALADMLDLTRAHLADALGIMMMCLDHDERLRRRREAEMPLRAHVEAPNDPDTSWQKLRLSSRR